MEQTGAYWPQFTVLRETDLVGLRVRGQGWGAFAHSQALLKPYVLCLCLSVNLGTHSLHCFQTLGVSFPAVKQIRSRGWGWTAVARKTEFQFLPNRQSPPAWPMSCCLVHMILPRRLERISAHPSPSGLLQYQANTQSVHFHSLTPKQQLPGHQREGKEPTKEPFLSQAQS